jgi:hypothetical protein
VRCAYPNDEAAQHSVTLFDHHLRSEERLSVNDLLRTNLERTLECLPVCVTQGPEIVIVGGAEALIHYRDAERRHAWLSRAREERSVM